MKEQNASNATQIQTKCMALTNRKTVAPQVYEYVHT